MWLVLKRLVNTSTPLVPLGERIGLPPPIMAREELEAWIAGKLQQLPYFVERTAYGKGLPVYSDLKNGRTRRLTVVRRVYGDIHALAKALRIEFPGIQKVDVRPLQQRIVLKGHLVDEVKAFLTNLGF